MPSLSELAKASPSEFFRMLSGRGQRTVVGTALTETNPVLRNTSLPRVNLLPDSYPERVRANNALGRFGLAFLVLVVLTILSLVLSALAGVLHAGQLTEAQQQTTQLNTQIGQLTPYKTYSDAVQAERTTLYNALKTDIDMPRILSSVASSANRYEVRFNTISLSINGQAATGSTPATGTGGCAADPFATASAIGCITLAGTAPSYSSASSFFSRLNDTKGFLNGALSTQTNGQGTTTTDGGRFTFQGSVQIDNQFYSNKYAALGVPLNLAQDGSAAPTQDSAGLAQQLVNRYPALKNASAAEVQALATGVCATASKPTTVAALATSTVQAARALGFTLTDTDAAAINTAIVAGQCAANSGNVQSDTTSSAPAATPSNTPGATASATAGE